MKQVKKLLKLKLELDAREDKKYKVEIIKTQGKIKNMR